MPDFTSANVLAAAGLSDLIGPRADFAFRKIINDHEVLDIAERLSRLGADHDPPPGWEARVLAAVATKQRRPTLRTSYEPTCAFFLSHPIFVIANSTICHA